MSQEWFDKFDLKNSMINDSGLPKRYQNKLTKIFTYWFKYSLEDLR